jgi:hypothetical protein
MSYMDMEQPRSTEALQAFCEAGRVEHNAAGDYLGLMAPRFQAALRKSVPGGALSSAIIAARISRHMKIAADANKMSARAFAALWFRYEELVLNAQSVDTPFKI